MWPTIAGFKDGKESYANECGQLLKAGKGKEMDSSLELSEQHSPADIFILAQWDIFRISDRQNCKT